MRSMFWLSSLFLLGANILRLVQALPSTPIIKSWGILLYPGFDALDIFGPLEYVNTLPGVEVYLLAESSLEPVWSNSLHANISGVTQTGVYIVPTHTLATAPPLDVLLVPGGYGTFAILDGGLGAEIAFIKDTYPSLKYLYTVCTGNALTAASGVIDGKRSTGNKADWAFVTAQGPKVDWVASARWTTDGNIWSSSGVEAGTDMIYAFITAVYGNKTADAIANTIEHIPNTDPTYDPFSLLYNTTGTAIPIRPAPPVPADAPTKFGILAYPGMESLDTWAAIEATLIAATPTTLAVIGKTLDPVPLNLLHGKPPVPIRVGGALPLRGQNIIPTTTIANNSLGIEVLIIPGASRVPFDAEVASFIAREYPKLRYVISVGTGAALVAESGVAKGHQATTSKYFYEDVKAHFPSVKWVPSARWTVSDDGKLWSSSGGVSILDTMYGFQSVVYGADASVWGANNLEYIQHTNASADPFAAIWHTT